MKKILPVCLVIFSFCIVYVSTIKASEEVSGNVLSVTSDNETFPVSDNETLILYYSKTGKTKIVAEELNHLYRVQLL